MRKLAVLSAERAEFTAFRPAERIAPGTKSSRLVSTGVGCGVEWRTMFTIPPLALPIVRRSKMKPSHAVRSISALSFVVLASGGCATLSIGGYGSATSDIPKYSASTFYDTTAWAKAISTTWFG